VLADVTIEILCAEHLLLAICSCQMPAHFVMNSNVPKFFVSVIIDWYNKIFVKVRWNETLSNLHRLKSGVRQGGNLSPSLFNIFVNDIHTQLQAFNTGCFIANKYVGALMYADDLLLVFVTLVIFLP